MYKVVRSFLFLFAPEKAHAITTKWLRILLKFPGMKRLFSYLYCTKDKRLERNLWGLTFKNPVGLAAGFDKNATLYDDFSLLGFGFIEIGTVTPKAQEGNPKPRLFRLKEDKALINRMGFNNFGAEKVTHQLKKKKHNIIVGGNIGKNKMTPNQQANEDYLAVFETLYPHVDYFVVNVSSPNTPNLRALQEKEVLKTLLLQLMEKNKAKPFPKPILVKIAPDLSNEQLDDIIDIVSSTKIQGVIATNTTIDRTQLSLSSQKVEQYGAGGLSGQPLKKRSTEVIRYLAEKSKGSFTIIGVGGINSSEDAIEKLNAGATLIQIYTGFVYEGPSLVKRINKAIIQLSAEK